MLRLISALLGLVLLLVIGLAAGLLLVRDASPDLPPMPELSAEQRRWGQELLHERLLAGVGAGGAPIVLTRADLGILAVLVAEQLPESRLHLGLEEGRAEVLLTLPLPNELGGWLNLSARLVAPDGTLGLEEVELGSLPVPPVLAELLMEQALVALDIPALPSGIAFSPDAVRVQPVLSTGAAREGVSALLPEDEQARVLAAQRRLTGLGLLRSGQRSADAAELLSALIASAPMGADPVAENRAAILALAAYVNGRSLPDPSGTPPPRSIPVLMRGRDDIPQHFLTSAALVLQGGSGLANLIGLAKELDDADSASGFSFSDLAANQAGNRFAELATDSPNAARRVQRLARAGLSADDIMPQVDWLPETMSRATFERDFGGRDGPTYRRVVEEIERRIEALPIVAAVKDSG
jgi:hypothetical protein